MDVHVTPDTEKKLTALAATTGRPTDDLVEDALAGYFDELAKTRDLLDRRYDELESGRVQPIDGEEVLGLLRARSDSRRARPL